MSKYRFRPWELQALTVNECLYLYVQAMVDEAEDARDKSKDEELTPDKKDAKAKELQDFFALKQAFAQLPTENKLAVARAMYPSRE